jgi:phosphoglycolate phosphatase
MSVNTGDSVPIVLFDLDGTVSDSAPGILASLRYAFDVNGIEALDAITERALLGPPFYESLPPIIGAHRLGPVIDAYRAHYADAMYDSTIFPGVPELLAALHADGRRLAVATSKPEHYAVPILQHLDVDQFFETIGGDELDGSLRTKALVIGKVRERMGDPPSTDIIMVGDRSHDIAGARAHGIDTIAVRWGYAMPGELEDACPLRICDTTEQLADSLGVSVHAHP